MIDGDTTADTAAVVPDAATTSVNNPGNDVGTVFPLRALTDVVLPFPIPIIVVLADEFAEKTADDTCTNFKTAASCSTTTP